ncbi:MAG TPA: class I SAM-dependent methyltransferase [Isosphaeraceae bacterium]|jgi:SAM-dependent methyltransferase
MSDETPPAWRLPAGVNASLWQYAQTPRLAEEEDDYFVGHPLFWRDAVEVDARFTEPGRVIDLGSGVGRHALRMAHHGFPTVAVELSQSMLAEVGRKAERMGVSVDRVRANLCRLECFPDGSFDYALSMFSTLGMIRTAAARRRALCEAARILKPGGRLALHAHNIWLNLRNKQGREWLRGRLPSILLGSETAGDRRMTYRRVPGMEVHLYRWGELKREIRAAGLRIEEVIKLDEVTARPIRAPWFVHSIRAGGWLLFCRRR